jgi:hypothetical protein
MPSVRGKLLPPDVAFVEINRSSKALLLANELPVAGGVIRDVVEAIEARHLARGHQNESLFDCGDTTLNQVALS